MQNLADVVKSDVHQVECMNACMFFGYFDVIYIALKN